MTVLIFYLLPLSLCHWRESGPLVMSEIWNWSASPIPVWNFRSLSLLLLCLYLLLDFLLHPLKHKVVCPTVLAYTLPTLFPPFLPQFLFLCLCIFSKSVVKNIKLRSQPETCTCKPSLFTCKPSLFRNTFFIHCRETKQPCSPSLEWDVVGLLATGKQKSKGL